MSASDKIRALKEKQAKDATAKVSGQTTPTPPVAPTTVKEEKAKEPCEFCGTEFSNLASHIKKCKDNPANQKAAPATPAFDVKAFFDEFKKYVVTPDQLMAILKAEAEQAKADRDRLDTFVREHQTMTPTIVESNGTPSEIKDLVVAIKEQGDILEQELKAKNDTITVLQNKVQYEQDIVKHIKDGVQTKIPPELTMLITSISKSWLDLLEPIEKRWKASTGYIKVINRLKTDIETLMKMVDHT